MPLPSLEKLTPVFDIVIPSTDMSVKFRPFFVQEEKILLVALEGGDEQSIADAISQVVSVCSVSPLKLESLANFDIEYAFLKLRAKSVGEQLYLSYLCQNQIDLSPEEAQRGQSLGVRRIDDPNSVQESLPVRAKCENQVNLTLNLNDVAVKKDPAHSKQVPLTDTLGLTMRYPNFEMAKRLAKVKSGASSMTEAMDSIAMCVESVFDAESVYSNFSVKEIGDWLQKLTPTQFANLENFFATMPKLEHDVPFHCAKCGYKSTVHLEGLSDFFG